MHSSRMKALLEAIPSTEPASFDEFCRALGPEKPDRDEKREWWELFVDIEALESEDLVEIERTKRGNGRLQIDTMILTEAGVAVLREMRSQ